MTVWKVLFVLVFAGVCFALALATIIAPLALTPEENKWLWTGGLLLGTICMGTLFTLYLRREDRAFLRDESRRGN
jgi:hypothetical protein